MSMSLAFRRPRLWASLVAAILLLQASLAVLGCARALGHARLIGPDGLEVAMGWSAVLAQGSVRLRHQARALDG